MEKELTQRVFDGKFRKRERIAKSKDFRAVYNKGISIKDGPFVLRYLPSLFSNSRLGFSISSRSIRSAFRRNRVRRLFREVYRRHKRMIKGRLDMVIVVRQNPPEKMAYQDAERVFIKLAKKAGISK